MSVFRNTLAWMDGNPGKSGALAGWAQQGVTALVALILIPVLVRHLPPDQCGLWFSFQGAIAVATLANFGIGTVIARQTAHCVGAHRNIEIKNDFIDFGHGPEGVAYLNLHAKRIYVLIVALCLTVGTLTFELVIPHTRMISGAASEFRLAWYLMLFNGVVLILSGRFTASLIGTNQTHVFKVLAAAFSTLQGISVVTAAVTTQSITIMALASLGASLAYLAILAFVVRQRIPAFRLRQPASIDRGLLRRMLKVSYPLGIVDIGAYLVTTIQVPMLGALLGPAAVTPFYLAQKISQFLTLGCQQSVQPQIPKFTQSYASGDSITCISLLGRTLKTLAILSFGAALFFCFASPIIANQLASLDHFLNLPTLTLMSLDLVTLSIISGLSQFILAAGRNPFMTPSLIGGAINVLLLMALVPQVGLMGIPCASLASGFLTNYWIAIKHGLRLKRQLVDTSSGRLSHSSTSFTTANTTRQTREN
jgi:O-antigen/teichoic acid export membrane protein